MLSYAVFKGSLPVNNEIHHTCENPGCVNPDHLIAVSHAENARIGRKAKLTEDQVREIKSRYKAGDQQDILAAEFDVNSGHISRIVNGKRWKGTQELL